MAVNTIRVIVVGGTTLTAIASLLKVPLKEVIDLNPRIRKELDKRKKEMATTELKPGTVVYVPNPRGFREQDFRVDRVEALRRRVAPRFAMLIEYMTWTAHIVFFNKENLFTDEVLPGKIRGIGDRGPRKPQDGEFRSRDEWDRRWGLGLHEPRDLAEVIHTIADDLAKKGKIKKGRYLRKIQARVGLDLIGTQAKPGPLAQTLDWIDRNAELWERIHVPVPFVMSIHPDDARASEALSFEDYRRSFNEPVLKAYDKNLDAMLKVLSKVCRELASAYSACSGGIMDVVQYPLIGAYMKVFAFLNETFDRSKSPSEFEELAKKDKVKEIEAKLEELLEQARELSLEQPAFTREVAQAVALDEYLDLLEQSDTLNQTINTKIEVTLLKTDYEQLKADMVESAEEVGWFFVDAVVLLPVPKPDAPPKPSVHLHRDLFWPRFVEWRNQVTVFQNQIDSPDFDPKHLEKLGENLTKLNQQLHMLWYLGYMVYYDVHVVANLTRLESVVADVEHLRFHIGKRAGLIVEQYDDHDYEYFEMCLTTYDRLLEQIEREMAEAKAKAEMIVAITKEVVWLIVITIATWGTCTALAAGASAVRLTVAGARIARAASVIGTAVRLHRGSKIVKLAAVAGEAFVFTSWSEAADAFRNPHEEKDENFVQHFCYEWAKNVVLFGALKAFHGHVRGIAATGKIEMVGGKLPPALLIYDWVGGYVALTLSAGVFFIGETVAHNYKEGKGIQGPEREEWVQFLVMNAVMLASLRFSMGAFQRGVEYTKGLKTTGKSAEFKVAELEADLKAVEKLIDGKADMLMKMERDLVLRDSLTKSQFNKLKKDYESAGKKMKQLLDKTSKLNKKLEAMRLKAEKEFLKRHRILTVEAETEAAVQQFLVKSMLVVKALKWRAPIHEHSALVLGRFGGTPVEVIGRDVIRANIPTIMSRVQGTVDPLAIPKKSHKVDISDVRDPDGFGDFIDGSMEYVLEIPSRRVATRMRVVDPRGEGRPGALPPLKAPPQDPRTVDVTPESVLERFERLAKQDKSPAEGPTVQKGLDKVRGHSKSERFENLLRELDGGHPLTHRGDRDLSQIMRILSRLKSEKALDGADAFMDFNGFKELIKLTEGKRAKGRHLTDEQLTAYFEHQLQPIAEAFELSRAEVRKQATAEGAAGRQKARAEAMEPLTGEDAIFEGFLLDTVVKDNATVFNNVRESVILSDPGMIVPIEKADVFIAETVAFEHVDLAPMVKPELAGKGKALGPELESEIANGNDKVVFIGKDRGQGRELVEDVLQKVAEKHVEADLRVIWIRETFGQEADMAAANQGQVKAMASGDKSSRVPQEVHATRVVIDGSGPTLAEGSTKPAHIFRKGKTSETKSEPEARITEVVEGKEGGAGTRGAVQRRVMRNASKARPPKARLSDRVFKITKKSKVAKRGVKAIQRYLSREESKSFLEKLEQIPKGDKDADLQAALELVGKIQSSQKAVEGFRDFVDRHSPQRAAEWAQKEAEGLSHGQLLGIFEGELKVFSDIINMTPKEIEAEILDPTLSRNKSRKTVVTKVRNKAKKKNKAKYEAFIEESLLAENQNAYAKVKFLLDRAKPDHVIGVKRGGELMARLLTGRDPVMREKVKAVEKEDLTSELPKVLRELAKDLKPGEKLKIAFVDSYMGGGQSNRLRDIVDPVMAEFAKANKDVEVDMFWMRETVGFETTRVGKGVKVPPAEGKTDPVIRERLRSFRFHVRLILGDDMVSVADRTKEPVRIYNKDGDVVSIHKPGPKETTEDVLIRLLFPTTP